MMLVKVPHRERLMALRYLDSIGDKKRGREIDMTVTGVKMTYNEYNLLRSYGASITNCTITNR